MPSTSSESQRIILEDVVYAVNFLEEITGLCYYPVTTLLVDEFVTKSVRAINTTDLNSVTECEKLKARILKLNDILHSIALEFHIKYRGLYPPSEAIDYQELDSAFGKGRLLLPEQFREISSECEGAIAATVEEYIDSFSNSIPSILRSLTDVIQKVKNDEIRMIISVTLWCYRKSHIVKLLQDELTLIGIKVSESKYKSLELNGSFSSFMSALNMFHKELSATFQQYNDCEITLPSDPVPCGERYQAIGLLVEAIIHNLDLHVSNLGRQLNRILNPSWRELREELVSLKTPNISSELDFVNFLDKLLKTISKLLNEGLVNLGDFYYKGGYFIKLKSWNLLLKEIPDLKLDSKLLDSDLFREESVLLRGNFSEFVRVFQIVATKLIEALRQIAHLNTPIQKLFAVEVPTYGIYVPPNSPDSDDRLKHWAFKQGIATELTLSNTPRVLFCLDAHEKFEKKLQKESAERQKISRLARDFQRSVLVHEHFHAILETGLDARRSPASGPKFKQEWKAASCLNESLAVWMELHAARQNQELMALIWDYIRADSYPRWPYRGAEKIEEIYQQQGIEAVRELIVSIRKDPEIAQSAFDSLPSKLNSGLL